MALTIVTVAPGLQSKAETKPVTSALARLAAAYPKFLKEITDDELVWHDGTRMPLTAPNADANAPAAKSRDPIIRASLQDMIATPYSIDQDPALIPPLADPGRARPSKFFLKMYGDCRKGKTRKHLTRISWLPGRTTKTLLVTSINGVDKQLAAVSRKLAALPKKYLKYLDPAGGTYNCRQIAGTKRLSPHSYGIAIDIAVKHTDYWRWHKPQADGQRPYRNKIPLEIVRIFEAHGFIWGGRWKHYDTMHFEYRPELLPKVATTTVDTTAK